MVKHMNEEAMMYPDDFLLEEENNQEAQWLGEKEYTQKQGKEALLETLTEHWLIHRIQARGDRKAANRLVEKYYKEIYSYVYRQTSDKELTMDLTQDIFYQVLKAVCKYDEKKSAFRTWLYRVAVNKVKDYYRSRAHHEQTATSELTEETEVTRKDFTEQVILREQAETVMSLVAVMSEENRQIFTRKLYEEQTFVEIARELQLSPNTVKTKYYTILKQLRKELEADEGTCTIPNG